MCAAPVLLLYPNILLFQGWLTRFKERHGISDIKSTHVSLNLILKSVHIFFVHKLKVKHFELQRVDYNSLP